MSPTVDKIHEDLAILAAMAAEMDDYLKSEVLYWPMVHGDMPRLTLGGYLMRQHRLQHLADILTDADKEQWETAVQTEDQQWTVSDIVRHLTNAESGMTNLIKEFQQGKDPVPPDFDRERYNNRSVAKKQDMTPADLMEAMTTNRTKLLEFIETLEEEDWQKKGRHASLNIYTIEEVCHVIADHEAAHLQDMQTAVHNS